MIAISIKGTNSEGIFTIKMTAKPISVAQVQTPRKRLLARPKKDQARTINFQLHPRRRPTTPLKPEPQTPQVKLRNHGGKRERKRDLSSGPSKNTQKEIKASKTLLHRKRGRHRHSPMTSTT